MHSNQTPSKDPLWVKIPLIALAIFWMALMIGVPVYTVFQEAFAQGWDHYCDALSHPDAIEALKLSGIVLLVVIPLNALFGICAAWLIAKFEFPGKNLLTTLIDIPFSVSPVIAGLVFVLLFGAQGLIGPWLESYDIHIIFATPGIILATLFVTFPFVARELIPVMQALGNEEEEASLVLGAGGLSTFLRITLPAIRWGLLYGVVLAGARALGEFGAVSVVSGHIRGQTNTLPLHVEILYNEYDTAGAFAVASVLTLVAVISLILKKTIEYKLSKEN